MLLLTNDGRCVPLTEITAGGIRIADNPRLCYVQSINWTSIVRNSTDIMTDMNNGRCLSRPPRPPLHADSALL